VLHNFSKELHHSHIGGRGKPFLWFNGFKITNLATVATHGDHARTDFYLPRLFNDSIHCSEGSSRNIVDPYRPTVEDWRSSDDLVRHFDDSYRHFDDLDHHFDDSDRHFDDVCDSRKHHRNAGTLIRNAYIILFKFQNIQFSNGVIKWSH